MSNTTSDAASPSPTDATYDFSIKEATIRNTAIGVCLALFVFLVCALIGLEIMRRRLKRMRKLLQTHISQEDGLSSTQYLGSRKMEDTQYLGSGRSLKMESPASSEDIRYQLVSPVARLPESHFSRSPERSVTNEVSVQGEVFESDARSVRSFHRGETHKHNKNVVNKWYDLRGHVGREG